MGRTCYYPKRQDMVNKEAFFPDRRYSNSECLELIRQFEDIEVCKISFPGAWLPFC